VYCCTECKKQLKDLKDGNRCPLCGKQIKDRCPVCKYSGTIIEFAENNGECPECVPYFDLKTKALLFCFLAFFLFFMAAGAPIGTFLSGVCFIIGFVGCYFLSALDSAMVKRETFTITSWKPRNLLTFVVFIVVGVGCICLGYWQRDRSAERWHGTAPPPAIDYAK